MEQPDAQQQLSHVDARGRARMVDVSAKPAMRRTARAQGLFVAAAGTIDRIMAGDLPKGEALAVARIAGIQAAKRTGELIPLCHPLGLDHVDVDFHRAGDQAIRVTATATVTAKTGVEMEALTAVTTACLTLYDMTKAVDKNLRIEALRLVEKTKAPAG